MAKKIVSFRLSQRKLEQIDEIISRLKAKQAPFFDYAKFDRTSVVELAISLMKENMDLQDKKLAEESERPKKRQKKVS